MNPTFYFGYVKRGEILEEIYNRDRPRIMVPGYGIATQFSITRTEVDSMSRIDAIGYLHSSAMTWMPAKAVRIDENPAGVEWMWGVWIAAPDDFFVDGTSEHCMTRRMLENHRRDFLQSREPSHDDHVIFLRV